MKKGIKAALLIGSFSFTGIISVGFALVYYNSHNRATVSIINRTGERLLSGNLKISSLPDPKQFGKIENGDSIKLSFKNFGDGEYIFSGSFESGKSIQESSGYVTNGMDFEDEIVLFVKGDSIKIGLDQNHIKKSNGYK